MMRMLLLILIHTHAMNLSSQNMYTFTKSSDLSSWRVVSDGVMGGVSKAKLNISDEGSGVFEGLVSLDNNGGFTMIQYNCEIRDVKKYSKIVVQLKGDGKTYQFRIKDQREAYYSYVQSFKTSTENERIELKLSDFKPTFRGRKLHMPHFTEDTIEQVGILIGNKKEEFFKLEINEIFLQ